MTSSSAGSRSVADRFGFEFCTGTLTRSFVINEINTVFVATRHDSHGKYVIAALKAGKHVFVEKPMCLTLDEYIEIKELSLATEAPLLMVGYNRRFAPLTVLFQSKIGSGLKAMIYRVNAGSIPGESWIQDPDIGGGRISW